MIEKCLLASSIICSPISIISAVAEPMLPDKGQYNWFNPTPRGQMRNLSPDRPDATESPITVDAGHYAFELSFFDWRRNAGTNTYTAMETNIKIGLTNTIDLQTVFSAYVRESSGKGRFGDVLFRLKYNVWGNDGGDTALGLLPFIKVPTKSALSNGAVEGGLAVPFAITLTDHMSLGLQAQFGSLYNEATRSHDFQFLHTTVLGFSLTERLGLYTEYVGITGDTRYQSYFSGGFTWQINGDLVLDCGTMVGLNDNAERLGVFAGFTKRF